MMRILAATAAVTMVSLLSACEAPKMAGASGAAPLTGAESCVRSVRSRSGSSGVKIVADSTSGGAGMIIASTPGNGNWTCYTNADGRVTYVKPDNRY